MEDSECPIITESTLNARPSCYFMSEDESVPVWPFYPPSGHDEPPCLRTGDVTRQEWEIPYIERVRQLNWTLRIENPTYQQWDAEEGVERGLIFFFPRGVGFTEANRETGHNEEIYLTEEPTIENLREMNIILSSSDIGEMWVNCLVDWTGGLPRGYDYRNPEEDWPESQPPGWTIKVAAFDLCEGGPWSFNGMLRMDGKSVYKLARAEDGDNKWDFEKSDEIVTDEDLAVLHEHERSKVLKTHDACSFIHSAAREAGLVIDESEVEKQLNFLKELSERDFSTTFAQDQAWQAARSKALSGHEPNSGWGLNRD